MGGPSTRAPSPVCVYRSHPATRNAKFVYSRTACSHSGTFCLCQRISGLYSLENGGEPRSAAYRSLVHAIADGCAKFLGITLRDIMPREGFLVSYEAAHNDEANRTFVLSHWA